MPNKTSILLRPVGSFFPRERLRGIWVFGGIPLLAFVAALVIRGVPLPEECDSGMIFFGRMLFIGVALLGIPVIMELLAENGARAWIPRKRSLLAGAGVLAVLWFLLHPQPSWREAEATADFRLNRYILLLSLFGIWIWAWFHVHACAIRMRSLLFGWVAVLLLSASLATATTAWHNMIQSIAGLGCILILLELALDIFARHECNHAPPPIHPPTRLQLPWSAFVLVFLSITLLVPQSLVYWSRGCNPIISLLYHAAFIFPVSLFIARALSRFGVGKRPWIVIHVGAFIGAGICLLDLSTHWMRDSSVFPVGPLLFSPLFFFLLMASVDVLLGRKWVTLKTPRYFYREESESLKALLRVPRLPLRKWKAVRSWRRQLVYLVLFWLMTPMICYAAVFYYYKSKYGTAISFAEMASIPAYWYGYWRMVFSAYLLGGIVIPCWLLLPRHLLARLSECWTTSMIEELSLTRLRPWDIIWGILVPPLLLFLIPALGTMVYSLVLGVVLTHALPDPYCLMARSDLLGNYYTFMFMLSILGVLFTGVLLTTRRNRFFRGALAILPSLLVTLLLGVYLGDAMFLPSLFINQAMRYAFIFVIGILIWRNVLRGLRAELDNFNPAR